MKIKFTGIQEKLIRKAIKTRLTWVGGYGGRGYSELFRYTSQLIKEDKRVVTVLTRSFMQCAKR